MRARQEGRLGPRMIAVAFVQQRIRVLVGHAAQHEHAIPNGGQRRHDRRELEITLPLRRPEGHAHAVRTVDGPEPLHRGRRGGECRHHPVEQRQSDGCPDAAQDRAARQTFLRNHHDTLLKRGDSSDSAICAVAATSLRRRSHLKGSTLDDSENQRRPAVLARRRLPEDRAKRRHVVVRRRPAEGVREELVREPADELVAVRHQHVPELVGALKLRSVGKHARRVDGQMSFARPPLPDAIEVFERESERIHPLMAPRTDRVLAVCFHPLAHRLLRALPRARLRERRHIRRRRRRRRAEDVVEQELPADHRRRPRRVRRDGQNAAVTEQAGPVRIASRPAGNECHTHSGCRRIEPDARSTNV